MATHVKTFVVCARNIKPQWCSGYVLTRMKVTTTYATQKLGQAAGAIIMMKSIANKNVTLK